MTTKLWTEADNMHTEKREIKRTLNYNGGYIWWPESPYIHCSQPTSSWETSLSFASNELYSVDSLADRVMSSNPRTVGRQATAMASRRPSQLTTNPVRNVPTKRPENSKLPGGGQHANDHLSCRCSQSSIHLAHLRE